MFLFFLYSSACLLFVVVLLMISFSFFPASVILLFPSLMQPTSLASFCNIPREGLECCARMIIKFLLDEPVTASQRHLVAVKKKFLGERFLAVAIDDLPELPLKPHIPGN